jgi:hypothetical protein
MHERDELDRQIDSALATYAGADDGLEERILARIAKTQTAQPRSRAWMWAIAVPAAACLLLLLALPRKSGIVAPESKSNATTQQVARAPAAMTAEAAPEPILPEATKRPREAHARAAHESVKHPLPVPAKLEVFPTPQPLSPEEQALVTFVTQVPEKQRKAVLDEEQNRAVPLAIASMRIPPLATPDEGKN